MPLAMRQRCCHPGAWIGLDAAKDPAGERGLRDSQGRARSAENRTRVSRRATRLRAPQPRRRAGPGAPEGRRSAPGGRRAEIAGRVSAADPTQRPAVKGPSRWFGVWAFTCYLQVSACVKSRFRTAKASRRRESCVGRGGVWRLPVLGEGGRNPGSEVARDGAHGGVSRVFLGCVPIGVAVSPNSARASIHPSVLPRRRARADRNRSSPQRGMYSCCHCGCARPVPGSAAPLARGHGSGGSAPCSTVGAARRALWRAPPTTAARFATGAATGCRAAWA